MDVLRAEGNLVDASTLVRQITGLTYLDDAGALDPSAVSDVVEMVVLASAKRAYENPTGVTQKTTGDASLSYAARAETAVYLTDSEIAMLRSTVGRSGLSTLSTTRGAHYIDTVYVPIVGTTAQFPWYDADDPLVLP